MENLYDLGALNQTCELSQIVYSFYLKNILDRSKKLKLAIQNKCYTDLGKRSISEYVKASEI